MPPQRKAKALPEDVQIRERSIDDYHQDEQNANRGNERGQQMIETSFRELGSGRSLVSDGDDRLIGGNHAIQGARAAGIKRVIEIDVPPDVLLVRRRSDLRLSEGGKARRLANADNRTQQVNLDFDPEALLAAPTLLEGFWREDEIAELMESADIDSMIETALDSEEPEGDRLTGQRVKQIKPVLYVHDLAVFEKAIAATGLTNRGEALLEICRKYLEDKANA